MKYKKIVSFICLTAIFSQNIPFDLLSYANEINKVEKIENIKEESDSTKEDKVSDTKVDTNEIATKTEENKDTNIEENKVSIEAYTFNAYIDGENELAFSLGFDTKEGKFIVKDRADKELSNKNPDSIIYKINVYDKENKEKIAIELTGKDKGISDKLDILNESKYEIGDFIQIIPINSKEGLKITGDIQGDINKEKEDYSDGIDEPDYIQNVRFEITEEGLKTVYNEAPVIHGLSDIKDVNDKNINIFEGISVTDDHDKEIDTSTIQTEVKQIDELSVEITYTATDSWGRTSSGSRIISGINPNNYIGTNFSNKNSTNATLSDVLITVGGIAYAGGQNTRFKLKFDIPSSTIKVIDVDSRVMNNQVDGEYFKFELYDKEMNLKKSVTLLGKDKSNSNKLKELNNLKYINGDHIYIWHKESSEKLKIAGNIEKSITENEENSTPSNNLDYSNGVAEENLINHRFEIKPKGLKSIKNEAPQISGLEPITVARGGTIEYWPKSGIKITDDKDTFSDETVKSGKVSVHHTEVDTSKLGEHKIIYTVTDSWGLSTKAERTVTVSGTNPIESKFIEVYDKQKELAFKIGFDAVSKTYMITNPNETQLNPDTDNIVFKFRVFSKDGMLKKTVNIKGRDQINKRILSKIDGFKYEAGDYIELWSEDAKNGIKITGGIENTKSENENSGDSESENTEPINVENESTDNNQNVDPSNGIPEDYSNGIDNIDYMNNVRFKINPSSLEAVYNKAPEIKFTEMTIKRGDEVRYLDGVTVSDDHDANFEELKTKVIYKPIDTNTTGVKSVEYRLTDSWGRTTIKNRDITVTDKTALEANKINVKGNNGVIFSLGFDSITKKYIVRDINLNNLPDDVNDDVFKMTVYTKNTTKTNGDFTEKHKVTITEEDLQNKKFVSKFNNLPFEEGDYISLWSYNSTSGVDIKLNKNNKNNESDPYTFENDDKMYNTRFKINESSGLENIYNAAPVINGVDTDFYILKGSNINLESVATVTDDLDDNDEITRKLQTTGIELVNKNVVGTYKVHYEVSDSWGRRTSKNVNMHVISKSVSNDIEFYNVDGSQKIFSLKYNPMKNKFEVRKADTETTVATATDGTSNSDTSNGGTVNDNVFRLTVFNKKSEEIHKIELNESDVQNINRLNEISKFDIQDGYYFSLWSNKPKRIKIQGNIIRGTSNEPESYINGNISEQQEDYADGIDSDDQMTNVRFEITEIGLKHIYNDAPTIKGVQQQLEAYAGDPIDYLKGITVSDTLDGDIDKTKVKITDGNDKPLDNKNDNGKLTIGNNTIKYTVEDSWGRKTTEETTLIIKEGIEKNTIVLQGGPNLETNNDIVTIGFDHETQKVTLEQKNEVFNNGMGGTWYYSIKIFGEDGREKIRHISINGNESGTSTKFNELKNIYRFEYGDKIELLAWHPNRVKFNGKVIDAREDYTDGFDIPMNLLNVKFEITHSGLKSVYEEKVRPTGNQKNIFAAIAPEGYVIQYAVEPGHGVTDGGKIKLVKDNAYSFWYEKGDANVAKIAVYNKDGTVKEEHIYQGRPDRGPNSKQFDNFVYQNGEYLFLQHMDPKRFAIYGNVEGQKEDYSDGFEQEIDMRNTIFKFTQNGLEAVYNDAPVINGIEDTVAYLGEDFDPLSGVTVTDDRDSDGTIRPTVNESEYRDELGEYNIEYTAVDSWGRRTTKTRKVIVVPRIYDNRFKIYSDSDSEGNLDTDIEATNTVDGEDSSDNPSGTENPIKEPIFEIGFDPFSNKYKVYNQKTDKFSEKNLNETAFYIEIRGSNGETKAKVTLTDNDRGNSPKLDVINNTNYTFGDTIQVYRRDHQGGIKITGTIGGDIVTNTEDYSDGIKNSDYMNNVRFTVEENRLTTVYNQAAQITSGSSKGTTIIKGKDVDLLEGVQVNDDKDNNLSANNIDIYLNEEKIGRNYTFDKVGKYKLHFMLVDSWGRATLIEVDISVESKVKLNDINVYDNNVLGLTIGFDTAQSKITVKKASITDGNAVKSSNNDTDHFTMIVRDKKGNTKYSIALNGNREHDISELVKIHEKDYSKYDTISLKGVNPNDVRITGDVVGQTTEYSNGFGQTTKYDEVRFMITDDGLKELKASVPTLTGIDEVTIKRGEEIDFMEEVHAETDDVYDEDYTITVNENGFNKMVEGTYTVEYNVTTNRGVEATYNRTVIVEPRTELEKVKFKINRGSTRSSENILTIGFDTITNKLRVINYSKTDVMPGSSSEVVLRLTAYNESGSNIANIELRGGETISMEFIDRVNKFDYQEGYSLSVLYKDYQNVVIEGNIESDTANNKTNYNQGVTNADQIQHVRFTIKEDGLKSVYNKAPVISGYESELIYYKGQILDPFKGINITDDHDKNITIHDITYDDTKVDLDEPGRYEMKYIAEDSWGRTSEVTRTIVVKSGLGLNKIEIHSLNNSGRVKRNTTNSKVFDIGFDDGKVKIGNKSNLQIDQNKPSENVVTIKIYDKSMNVQKEVTLTGNDNGNSNKLDTLEDYDIKADDFISIEGISNDFAQRGIKITGTVFDQKEEYSDGIQDMDNINNVRFKSTEFGLKSVYNEAPTIKFEGRLDALLGDGNDIDFTKGATIKDDHDILGEDNIKVTGLDNADSIGEYDVTYTVTDLWGRETTSTRKVYLHNALNYDIIKFMGHRNDNDYENVEVALNMTFDTENKKIKVSEGEDLYFRKGNKTNIQYRVTLFNANGDEVMSKAVKGEDKANATDMAFRDFNDVNFEYGYKLKLYAWHQDLLRIQGPVRNAREDYSDGVQLGDSYTNVEFEITKSGLKSIYTQEEALNQDKVNVIAPSSREGHPFKLKIDFNSKNIIGYEGQKYSIEYGTSDKSLEISLYGSNGNLKRQMIMDGNENGKSDAANALNGKFDFGDYITVWHRTPKNLSIKGNIINQKEDYSDGIDDEEYMTHVAFKLTEGGMKSIYMAPPTIEGVKDKVFHKGDEINDNQLKENVTAIDVEGRDLTNSINMIHDIDTEHAGLYDITYSVTDSNDVSASVTSTVQVQAKPEIYVNRGRETIELNSLTNLTEEELDARLKDIVTVFDEEDDEFNKTVKLELVYNKKNMIDSTQLGGTSTVRYRATDSDGNQTERDVLVTIIRTINVSVPTVIPFQVVTNLKNKENEESSDQFVSGILKLKNNNTSDVKVSLKSFNKQANSGDLELVDPRTDRTNWDTLSSDETMRKMALGMYHKSGLNNTEGAIPSKENPLWLTSGMTEQKLGTLPRATKISEPYEAKLSFTSKHGKNFKGGTARGKFDLVFKFE